MNGHACHWLTRLAWPKLRHTSGIVQNSMDLVRVGAVSVQTGSGCSAPTPRSQTLRPFSLAPWPAGGILTSSTFVSMDCASEVYQDLGGSWCCPWLCTWASCTARCQEDAPSQGDAHVCSQAPRHTACAVRCSEEVVHPLERPVLPGCCPFWGS